MEKRDILDNYFKNHLESFETMTKRYLNLLSEDYENTESHKKASLFLLNSKEFDFFKQIDDHIAKKPQNVDYTDIFSRVAIYCKKEDWDEIFKRVDTIFGYIHHTDGFHLKGLILKFLENESEFPDYFNNLLLNNTYPELINCFSYYVSNLYNVDKNKGLKLFWEISKRDEFNCNRECLVGAQWFRESEDSINDILSFLVKFLDSTYPILKGESIATLMILLPFYEEKILPIIENILNNKLDVETARIITNNFKSGLSNVKSDELYNRVVLHRNILLLGEPKTISNIGQSLHYRLLNKDDFSIILILITTLCEFDIEKRRPYNNLFRDSLSGFVKYHLKSNNKKVYRLLTELLFIHNSFAVKMFDGLLTEMWIDGVRSAYLILNQEDKIDDENFSIICKRILGTSIHFCNKASLLFCLNSVAETKEKREFLASCFYEILGRDFLDEAISFLKSKKESINKNENHWSVETLGKLESKKASIEATFSPRKEHYPPSWISSKYHRYEAELYKLGYKEVEAEGGFLLSHVKNFKFKYGKNFGVSHKETSGYMKVSSPKEKIPLSLKHDEIGYEVENGGFRHNFKGDVSKK